MAQWNDYINLFPDLEQAVIQELQTTLANEYGYPDYESFENDFTNFSSQDFINGNTSNFFIVLSSWLGNKASSIGDWNDFPAQFNDNDQPYIDLIVQEYQAEPVSNFEEQDNEARADQIKNISGFWEAYLQTLASYIQDLNNFLTITTQPISSEIDWNTSYLLKVEAVGIGTLSYQWRKNGIPINGATSSTYNLEDVRTKDSAQYDCIVSDSCGERISVKAFIDIVSFNSEINSVSGSVITENEVPLENITVKVIDRKPGATKELGNTTTASDGSYRIEYLKSDLLDQDGFKANLVVQLFESGGTEVKENSSLIKAASSNEEVDFATSKFAPTETEFELIEAYINDSLDEGITYNDLDSEDVSLLANKQFSSDAIEAFIHAQNLNSSIASVSTENFYGLLRQNVPHQLEAIAVYSGDEMVEALIKSSEKNIITALEESTAQGIRDSIYSEAPAIIEQSNQNPFKVALDKAKLTLSSDQKEAIVEAHIDHPTGEIDVWQAIIDDTSNNLSESDVNEIQRALDIQNIDSTNKTMIDVIDSKVGNPALGTNLVELAAYTVTNWEALIDDEDETLLSIPMNYKGTDAERKTAYAEALRSNVERMIPTNVVASRMSADATFESTDFDEFFAEQPDFKFEEDSLATYLNSNTMEQANYTNPIADVQSQVEAAQRLFRISPEVDKFESMKPLMAAGVNSSSKIITMGRPTFVSTFEQSLGRSVADSIFDNAADTYGKLMHLTTAYHSTPGPVVIGNTSFSQGDAVDGIANLESLFGSLDYCSCTHCRSVYSPAAYLVDLLRFIDHEPKDENDVSIGYNLKDELVSRRNEIQKLFLNCDNTNTPLPYIDIVNEILENHISMNYVTPAGTEQFYQTTEDAETLRGTAQNQIDTVYETTLKNANFPYQLPFNLFFEETKSYSKELGIELGNLIEALPKGALTETEHKAIAAAAKLGVSKQQLDIINGSSALTSSNLYDITSIEDVINPVGTFLTKAGVSFELYEELLGSKYINPDEKILFYPTDGSCNLDAMTLGHNPKDFADPENDPAFNPAEGFSEDELLRFNRFLRLKELSGWSVKDLDIVINAIGQGADKLNNETIIELSKVAELKEKFSIEVEELVIWWTDFKVVTFTDENLFDKIFQDAAVNHKLEDLVIPPLVELLDSPPASSFLDDIDVKPFVLGAVRLSAKELDYIFQVGDISNGIDEISLSYLYRISSFIRATKISIEEYYERRDLLQEDGIKVTSNKTPSDTLDFLMKLDRIENSPFSIKDVDYLIKGENHSEHSLADDQIVDLLQELRDEFIDLGLVFPLTATDLNTEVEDLISLYYTDRDYIDDVISGAVTMGGSSSQAVIETFGFLMTAAEIVTFADDDMPYATTESSRKALIYNFLQRHHLVQTIIASALADKLAVLYGLPADITSTLLTGLENPAATKTFNAILCDTELLSMATEINEANYAEAFAIMQVASKVVFIARGLFVTAEELDYLLKGIPSNWFQLRYLPVNGATAIDFNNLEELIFLREMDASVFNNEITLIEFLARQTASNRIDSLSEATEWSVADITLLVGSQGFDFEATPTVYEEVEWLRQIEAIMIYLLKAKLDAGSALNLQFTNPDEEASFSMRNLLSARFGKEHWSAVAAKVHDPIREMKRDAMVAYLVATDNEFDSVSDIFDHFLIDTQMSACQLTSRIKQSISAVQLYIQRIALGNEGASFLNADKMDEWDWYKNYRVWEANRKVFLYPENYIIPELRLSQSKLYTELESELSQEEVTNKSAEAAFEKYMIGFKEINNIEINQMCYDDASRTLHLIGNNQQEPKQYFYRSLTKESIWSAWEEIPLKISGTVLPIMYRGSLMLCWLHANIKKSSPDISSLSYDPNPISGSTTLRTIDVDAAELESETNMQLAWTFKNSAGWDEMKLSDAAMTQDNLSLDEVVMIPMFKTKNKFYISFNKYTRGNSGNIISLTPFWALKYGLGNFTEVAIDDDTDLDSLYVNYTQTQKAATSQVHDSLYNRDYDFDIDTVGVYYFGPIQGGSFNRDHLDFDADEKRWFNFGHFSYDLNGNTGEAMYRNHKLELPRVTSLNVVHEVNMSNISPVHDRDVNISKLEDAKIGLKHTALLSSFSKRNLKVLKEIGRDFPMLSKKSLIENPGDKSPFFIKDGDRTFIVFVERYPHNPRRALLLEHDEVFLPSNTLAYPYYPSRLVVAEYDIDTGLL